MNCAIHTDVPAAAYCRTCGKALCQNCKRDVKGVIYCEDCIAARVHDTMPVATPAQAGPVPTQPVVPVVVSGPSPGLAGVLAFFFPFGIGQVYNRQYVKGLVFMLTFAFLIWGTSSSGDTLGPILGIAIAFYYIYQIIDAVRAAKAIQLGQPVPDPLGIEAALGGSQLQWSSGAPVGAIILIALGCLFLVHNLGFLHLRIGNWWPLVLVGLGIWMFTRRRTTTCSCVRCRCRAIVWPTFVLTLGVLWLLHTLDVKSFGATWPLILIVVGLAWVLQNNGPMTGHVDEADGPGPTDMQGNGEPRQEVSNV